MDHCMSGLDLTNSHVKVKWILPVQLKQRSLINNAGCLIYTTSNFSNSHYLMQK